MTTEQPQATPSPRLLRRRATDRVIGGVAAGIGDYLNIDPVLVRAVFVGLVIFGGAGLVLYLVAWLLIPIEGRDESPLEQLLPPSGAIVRVVLVIAAIAFLGAVVLPISDWTFGSTWPALIVVAMVVAGIYLLRRGGPAETGAPGVSPAAVAPAAADHRQPRHPRQAPSSRRPQNVDPRCHARRWAGTSPPPR